MESYKRAINSKTEGKDQTKDPRNATLALQHALRIFLRNNVLQIGSAQAGNGAINPNDGQQSKRSILRRKKVNIHVYENRYTSTCIPSGLFYSCDQFSPQTDRYAKFNNSIG